MSPAVMKLFKRRPPTWDEVTEALGQSGREEMIAAARQLLLTEEAFERITNRQYLMTEANYAERLAFSVLCRCLHYQSWAERQRAIPSRRVGLLTPLRKVRIDPCAGFAMVDASKWGLARLAIDEAKFCFAKTISKHLPNRPDTTEPVQLPKPLVGSNLMRLARHRAMVRVVGDYLGCVPILLGVKLILKGPDSAHDFRPQSYHLDGEDFRQIKVLLAVEEIDADSGALHLVRADHSEEIQIRTGYRLDSPPLDDATVYAHGARPTICTGRWGTLLFVDTSRCFHLEKSATANIHRIVVFEYVTPASPLFSVQKSAIETKIAEAAAVAGLGGRVDRLLFGTQR
jgi:hypothetical protein